MKRLDVNVCVCTHCVMNGALEIAEAQPSSPLSLYNEEITIQTLLHKSTFLAHFHVFSGHHTPFLTN